MICWNLVWQLILCVILFFCKPQASAAGVSASDQIREEIKTQSPAGVWGRVLPSDWKVRVRVTSLFYEAVYWKSENTHVWSSCPKQNLPKRRPHSDERWVPRIQAAQGQTTPPGSAAQQTRGLQIHVNPFTLYLLMWNSIYHSQTNSVNLKVKHVAWTHLIPVWKVPR